MQTGDVLVSTVRPNLNAVAIVPEWLDGEITSMGFCVLRTDCDSLNHGYLPSHAQHADFVSQIMAHVRGANHPPATDGTVKAATVFLPSPSEQRRIAEILDQADALRKKRAEADKFADRILPALFDKMFGEPVANSQGWEVDPLGQLGELDRGRSRRRPCNDPRLLRGPYPFIQPGDVAGAHGYDNRQAEAKVNLGRMF